MLHNISFEWEDTGGDDYDDLMAALIQLGASDITDVIIEEAESKKPIRSKKPKPITKWVGE